MQNVRQQTTNKSRRQKALHSGEARIVLKWNCYESMSKQMTVETCNKKPVESRLTLKAAQLCLVAVIVVAGRDHRAAVEPSTVARND